MEIHNKVNELAKKFTPKFSDTEKMLLLSIIDDVKEIVESTKTDGPSVEEKKATWRLIAEQYADSASSSGLPVRTEAQLKRCWINLKFRCRRSDSGRKQHQLKTGGGPPIVIDDDEEDMHERVRSIVPTIDFTLRNRWDSTSGIEGNMEDTQDVFEKDVLESTDSSLSRHSSKFCTDSSLSRHSSKSFTVGNSVQRKPLNALHNILPKNDEDLKENQFNQCKDLSEGPSKKKMKLPIGLEIEHDLRIQKLEESMKQQSELHAEKLKIIRKECEYWEEMKAAAKFEMQAMQAQVKYWRAKYGALESDI